jgi:Cu/Ag efflux pump CusA
MTPVSSLMGEILLVGLRSHDGKVLPVDLRTLADWTIKRRLQSISGVAEVLTIGGGVKQIQVQPNPNRLAAFGVTFEEVEAATSRAAGNATSGYLQAGPREIMVRNLGMTTRLEDIAQTVIKTVGDRPVLISDVADVKHDVQPMRGDASVNGTMGVVLSIDKAPGFDTLKLTARIEPRSKSCGPRCRRASLRRSCSARAISSSMPSAISPKPFVTGRSWSRSFCFSSC